MSKVNTLQLKYFLEDFVDRSETYILEEGAEKNEIFEVAKAHGILLKDSKDLAGFKTVYAFTDKPNANGAILPKKELLKALPTLVGKPIDIDHNRRYVVGFYIDYKYIHKTGTIIAYGIFFKSNFADEWEEAKKLFKEKKLATSFEIWAPQNKRKVNPDGTYELHDMEIAGGALIYKEQPAFKDAKVLEIAKKNIECKDGKCDLVETKKEYKEDELLYISRLVSFKIKCSACNEEFEAQFEREFYKCPYCGAIVNKQGEVLSMRTEGELKIACPSCLGREWAVLEESDEFTKLKCLGCGEEYKICYQKVNSQDVVNKSHLRLLVSKVIPCVVCGKDIRISFLSGQEKATVQCKSCGVKFEIDLLKKKEKKIVKKIEKASSEGGSKDMEKIKVDKFHRYVDVDEKEIEKFEEEIATELEEAKKLSYQERKNLPDSVFALILRVRNKRTGGWRKIRMFPIHDEAHVRNALARLNQEKVINHLKALKVKKDKILKKILKRAKELKMYSLLLRHEDDCKRLGISIPKMVEKSSMDEKRLRLLNKYKELRQKVKELEKARQETEDKLSQIVKEYEDKIKALQEEFEQKVQKEIEKAKIIAERREQLGEFAKDLTDEQLLDEKEFEIALLKKKVAELEKASKNVSSPAVGSVSTDDKITQLRKKIDEYAFGKRE